MSSVPAIVGSMSPMPAAEARQVVDSIKGHLGAARKLIYELYQREGWRGLGYSSWAECVDGEFEEHRSAIYRQLSAAQIEVHLSPNGDKESFIGSHPESQLRPLAPYRDQPEVVRSVLSRAAESAGDRRVTARHVEAAVEELYPRRDPEEADQYEDNPSLVAPAARPPLPAQATLPLDREPAEEVIDVEYEESEPARRPEPQLPAEKNAERWAEIVSHVNTFFVSLPRRGGIAGLFSRWPEPRRRAFIDCLKEARDKFDAAIAEAERVIR